MESTLGTPRSVNELQRWDSRPQPRSQVVHRFPQPQHFSTHEELAREVAWMTPRKKLRIVWPVVGLFAVLPIGITAALFQLPGLTVLGFVLLVVCAPLAWMRGPR